MTEKGQTFTYQARLCCDEHTSHIFDECALLFSKVERNLFQDMTKGKNINALKCSYIKTFQITARQFNSCRSLVEGKIFSLKEIRNQTIENLKERLKSLQMRIERGKNKKIIHLKKRRFHRLECKLKRLEKDRKDEKIHLCFGGKKLFNAQFHLEENGFQSHQEWKEVFDHARNSEFFLLGSKDETAGNQSSVATLNEDGTLSLKVRLPNALVSKYGKYLFLPSVKISYGYQVIKENLQSCTMRKELKDNSFGQALTYRFKKDKKGWRIFISTKAQKPKEETHLGHGVIGIDINRNHIACTEIDRFGNYLSKRTFSLSTYGKTKNQTLALIGDVTSEIVDWAKRVKKPIVIEKLDFKKKKTTLREESTPHLARQLSSFAYKRIIEMIQSRAYRNGTATYFINPAFTSVIGLIKFAKRYGLSKHHAAAMSIARRIYGFSEKPPKSKKVTIPDGKEGQFTLSLPDRNRDKHVWTFWKRSSKKLRAAHAEHFRAIKNRFSDPPKAIGVMKTPDIVGEIPACESLAQLLG